MIEELNQIYPKIAESILSSEEDSNWHKSVLKIAVIERSVDFNLNFFYETGQRKNLKLQNAFHTGRVVVKLHELTHKSGMSRWNRAVFTLMPDNKFDLEFIWDQDLEDQIKRLSKET